MNKLKKIRNIMLKTKVVDLITVHRRYAKLLFIKEYSK